MNGPASLFGPAALSWSEWGGLTPLGLCLMAWQVKRVRVRHRTAPAVTVFGEIHRRVCRERPRLFHAPRAKSWTAATRLRRLEAARERLRECGYFREQP
jgi:hypothetical protein